MSPFARPASAWIGALLATAVALSLIAMDAWHLAARANEIELALLRAFAPHRGGTAADWPALARLLGAPMLRLGELAGLAMFGLGLVLVIAWRGLLSGFVFLIGVVAGTELLALWLFLGPHLLLGTLASSVALAAAYGAALLWHLVAMARWRWRMSAMFDGVLSQQNLRQLLHIKGGDGLELHSTQASCLALRIGAPRGATGPLPTENFSARLEALAQLAEIAKHHGGLICELSPHGFTATWNLVVREPQPGARACAAALAMVQGLGPQRLDGGHSVMRFELAIGVTTGSLDAGILSLGLKPSYLVAGSCADRARDLRDKAERFGTTILVCSETRNLAAGGYAFLEIEREASAVAGAETPAGLYALWGPLAASSSPKFRALAVFHDRLFQALCSGQWASARELIGQARKLSGASQKLYDHYAEHLGWLEQHPPTEVKNMAQDQPSRSFTRQQPTQPVP